MTKKKSKKEPSKPVCAQCKKAEAKFYSSYDDDKILFCSSECHEIYNDKNNVTSNPLLIELQMEDNDDHGETEVNDVFKACHRGDENYQALQSQFQLYGENANQKNAKGQTLLTYAIAKGDVRTLDLLLLAGAEIDAADDNGDTALMVAAQLESEMKTEFLLNKGAQTTVVDGEGKTALHRTEQNKTVQCAQLLITKDPGLIHTKDKHMQTVLHLAAGEGNEELVRFLLEQGSKPDELDNLCRTPLHWAVIQSAKVSVEVLLESQDNAIDAKDKFGLYPIHYAVQVNRPDIARILVHKGCNLRLVDGSGRTPFIYAASVGNQEICQIILEKDTDMNSADREGFTALHFAASRGDGALCQLLLDQGADADPTNGKRETPLHLAAANEHKDVLVILLNSGSKGLSLADEDGRTPVHYAAECDCIDVLKILVKYVKMPSEKDKTESGNNSQEKSEGSDNVLDIRDSENQTSLYLAASREYKECCEVLLERGASVDDESRPHLIEMGLVEAEKEKEPVEEPQEEPKEAEAPVEAEADEEDGGALTIKERYAPSITPEVPQIELSPVTDKEVIANTSRHIHDDVMSTRSNGSTRKSKPDSWSKFMEQKKKNKDTMMQTTRSISKPMGSPYLVPQVDRHIFRRYLIGHKTAHDIYSQKKSANHEAVYLQDGGDSTRYSQSRRSSSTSQPNGNGGS